MKRVYKTIAKEGDLEDGKGMIAQAGDELIALFFKDGQYYAINAICPHQNATIYYEELKGYNAICYRHFLGFDVRDGRCINASMFSTQTFELKIENGEIKALVWED